MADPIDLTDETVWPDSALVALAVQVTAEQHRRTTVRVAGDEIDRLTGEYQAAAGIAEARTEANPATWEPWDSNPLTLPRRGQYFRHPNTGVVYESLISGNVWEPGDPDDPQNSRWWRDTRPAPPGIQPWVQPVPGLPDKPPYKQDDRVSHKGRVWRSTFAGQNVWEPGIDQRYWVDEGPAA